MVLYSSSAFPFLVYFGNCPLPKKCRPAIFYEFSSLIQKTEEDIMEQILLLTKLQRQKCLQNEELFSHEIKNII